MEVLARYGVNRISLGVQSFQAEHLQTLERDHTPEVVAGVVDNLRQHGFQNISLDLIYGVPGQTLDEWVDTLNQAISLNPEHISTYGLTYEKGTSFWTRREKGAISPVHDELERSMYAEAMSRLPAHGYQQYELSNFAKPSFECLHNQVYWNAKPYFGFGPGAASYLDGVRRMNHRSVTTWLKRVRAGESPEMDREELTPELLAREAVMLGLRQIKGIDLTEFEARFGCTIQSLAPEAWKRFLDSGLLEVRSNRVALSAEGKFLADSVVVEFI
jgi:oxygen-independent coproporphyrinogen-3 oxidase